MGGLPNQMPNVPNQADFTLGNFLAAKDMVDRNPGGRKKKWPLAAACILLAAVATLLITFWWTAVGRYQTGAETGLPEQVENASQPGTVTGENGETLYRWGMGPGPQE